MSVGDTAVQVTTILWGHRLIYFYLFTVCAREPCWLHGWLRALQRSVSAVHRMANSPPVSSFLETSYTIALEETVNSIDLWPFLRKVKENLSGILITRNFIFCC